MFQNKLPSIPAEIKMLTVATIFMTVPFILYMKDMAHSLRTIAEKR